jgi:hypothetical protein
MGYSCEAIISSCTRESGDRCSASTPALTEGVEWSARYAIAYHGQLSHQVKQATVATSRTAWAHVVIPLLIGGLAYVLLRPKGLLMFEWFYAIGLDRGVEAARAHEIVRNATVILPSWALYSAPDALWTYALMFFVAYVWRGEWHTLRAQFWLAIGLAGGVGAECGQLLGVVPGTFDWADLWLCSAASLFGLVATCKRKGT